MVAMGETTTAFMKGLPKRGLRREGDVIQYNGTGQLPVRSSKKSPSKVLTPSNACLACVGATMLASSSTFAANPVVMEIAKNEPVIVTVFWTAMWASYTLSISFIVWGRNGL